MKKTYTRNELNAVNAKIEKLNTVSGEKLPYAASKNHDKVKRELKVIQDEVNKVRSVKAPREDEYHTKWQEMYKASAKKDDKGNPIVIGEGHNAHYDIEDVADFNLLAQALDVEYKDVVDDANAKNAKLQAFVSQTVELNFHEIDGDFLERGQGYMATKEQIDIIRELFVVPTVEAEEVETKRPIIKTADVEEAQLV